MQKWPKEMGLQDDKTYFIEKINLGLLKSNQTKAIDYVETLEDYRSKFDSNWDVKSDLKPKIHTIRKDESERWKPGMKIHFVVNNRSPNRFQFAPIVQCACVQNIEIINAENYGIGDPKVSYSGKINISGIDWFFGLIVKVDGRTLKKKEVQNFVVNDGFESVWDFFLYFQHDFKGRLIHWTNLRY